jgi:hypothetical protein
MSKINTFTNRQVADAELHDLPRGSPAINASKQKMRPKNVRQRDAERRGREKSHTANLAAI